MNLNTLFEQVAAGQVQALELLSLEGGFYLLRAMANAGPVTLSDDQGQAVRFHSITQLRQTLAGLQPVPCMLVQQVVHDEMCGQRDGPVAPLRVPVTLDEQW
ncbi:metal ABC transporter ATPase [Pseudomonas soli]|jgi:hypothetical protein|uniref:DUF6482 family protein n=1 Tax=Pseudomonas soli TaxID=1306993 RepID=A0A1H8ZEE6_9PSED|nr:MULTISPECIES: DUF6482 family protein [Pseudomonas]AIN58630.1 metal ABC transporter ATPase [Pseudomonas soli]AUY31896.1 metal ABC transporter ATPase [Pseudomonas sp. PONIH3]MCX5510004.1 DUF6482 family protein [Pseudomonas sp. BJa3]MDT3716729.1 DUF6482 family protein [Pseudomonas soli]MDT3733520.1 DUF6482 family protein [Pseudomonas soli]